MRLTHVCAKLSWKVQRFCGTEAMRGAGWAQLRLYRCSDEPFEFAQSRLADVMPNLA